LKSGSHVVGLSLHYWDTLQATVVISSTSLSYSVIIKLLRGDVKNVAEIDERSL
jgi:hypothetical protein